MAKVIDINKTLIANLKKEMEAHAAEHKKFIAENTVECGGKPLKRTYTYWAR